MRVEFETIRFVHLSQGFHGIVGDGGRRRDIR
jgi:hypothetical protein